MDGKGDRSEEMGRRTDGGGGREAYGNCEGRARLIRPPSSRNYRYRTGFVHCIAWHCVRSLVP
jgi:hypothetical protein